MHLGCGKRAEIFESNSNIHNEGNASAKGGISKLGAWPWYTGILVKADEAYDYNEHVHDLDDWYENGDSAL